ncbi:hypothetical protein BCA37_21455 [Mycobacterium sp. djl-10]|nr:hypothetical protein BCA37_21455 [Mycobacterium sp. djl-10]
MSRPVSFPDGRLPVVLSAHAADLVRADAAAVLGHLNDRPDIDVAAVAAQLLRTRRIRRHRTVIRAADRTELIAGLAAVATGEEHPLVTHSGAAAPPRLAFVLPGQGNQWPGMGADAYTLLPDYRATAEVFEVAFAAAGHDTPGPYLRGDAREFTQIQIQAAQFVHAVALAAVWRRCGVTPDLTVGHSLGEVAAAYLAGTITADAAVGVVAARAGVVGELPGEYGMAVLGIDADAARTLIDDTPGWLELSVINAGSSVVVSGERTAVAQLVRDAEHSGRFARHIDVDFPAHTSALEPLRTTLPARLPKAEFTDSAVQFIGSATGAVVTPGTDFADYWYANLRNTVRFDRALGTALRCGATAFVELSAHPALLFALSDLLDNAPELPEGPAVLVGSGHRDRALIDELSANIAAAAIADPGYRWIGLLPQVNRPALHHFPPAPMRAGFFWAAPQPLPQTPPVSVLTETWTPAPPASAGDRHIAVLDLGEDDTIAETVRAAARAVPVADADLVLVLAPRDTSGDVTRAAADLADRLNAGLLDYVEELSPRCRDVWLVTAGGVCARAGDQTPAPVQAALAVMHRSLGYEAADQAFHHLDLPGWDTDATTLLDAVLSAHGEVALRDGGLLRRDVAQNPPDAAAPPLTADQLDSVVITGGSGTIALHFARNLVERGARRIVLLSRRGADAPAVREFLRSCPDGVEVHAPVCDITDRQAVASAAEAYAGGGASLVIHAAGTAAFAPRLVVNGAHLQQMCAAKLTGLTHLVCAWPLRAEARMLLCSSVIGVWGGKNATGYAAANRLLDVLAAQLRSQGHRCASVRWGLWHGSDIIDAAEISRVQRAGLRQMPAPAAVEAGLRDHAGDPLVLSADPDRLRTFFGEEQPAAQSPTANTPARATDAVRAELVTVLNIADRPLDPAATLFDLGMDSLLALDLRKRITRVTGRSVALATLLGGITVREFVATFEESDSPT